MKRISLLIIACFLCCLFMVTLYMHHRGREGVRKVFYNSEGQKMKVIYSVTESYWNLDYLSDFSSCQFKNCLLKTGMNQKDLKNADVLLFQFDKVGQHLLHSYKERARQLWVIYGLESPAYPYNRWKPEYVDGRFNITVTYRSDSNVVVPYSKVALKAAASAPINYATRKSKGAFAYVSNCDSVGYNRIGLMEELKEFIDVDIYGKCTNNYPCKRGDFLCEDKEHKRYRFYLSFENSLCKDYITEKFWNRLKSDGIFIPVAMGGLSLEDYNKVAPPASYLHVYNFTTIAELGKHLKYLMENDEAYNAYHVWREKYAIKFYNLCDLCKVVNTVQSFPAKDNLANWWNSDSCKL